jgi:polysaccharide biosynthesis transport protein
MSFAELRGSSDEELSYQLPQPSRNRLLARRVAMAEELSLGGYWRLLRRRRWYAITFVIVVVTLVTVVSFNLTPRYLATSRISIHPEDNNVADFKDVTPTTPNNWDYELELDAQAKILQSDTLALRTIEALSLHLDQKGHFLQGVRPQGEGGPSPPLQLDPTQEAKLLGLFRNGLTVSKVAHSPVIQIQYSSTDPRLSTDIVNTLVNNYVEDSFRTRYDSMQQAAKFLFKQLMDLRLKVDAAQEKLVEYERQKGILGMDEKQNIITEKLDQLNKELTAAQADRIQKEAIVKRFESTGDPALGSSVTDSQVLQRLKEQDAELRTQYAQLNTVFGPSYPKVEELRNELEQTDEAIRREVASIVGRARSDYLIAVNREEMLKKALEAQKQQANQLNESAIEYETLKHDADSSRQLYEAMMTKEKEAGVSAGLHSSNIRVIDPARVPSSPAWPKIPVNIAMALLFGGLGGILLAVVVDRLDDTICTWEQAQNVSALPALATIPRIAASPRAKLPWKRHLRNLPVESSPIDYAMELASHFHPTSGIAESYRTLRTSLLLSGSRTPPKVVLITSALPGECKTTTSINSAIVLAQRGGRVLLVDADLRRSGMNRLLRVRTNYGLTTLLAGTRDFPSCIIPSPLLPNLFVLPAGPKVPNPTELLSSTIFERELGRWRKAFDHIIIDTPPVLSGADAVMLSVHADSVVLVLRSGSTKRDDFRRAHELLARVNARITGVVINAFDAVAFGYSGYYGSGYGGNRGDDALVGASDGGMEAAPGSPT